MRIRHAAFLSTSFFLALAAFSGCSTAPPLEPAVQSLAARLMPAPIGAGSAPAISPGRLQPIAVTASSSAPAKAPTNATDGSSATIWDSGTSAPGWIQLDLGRTLSLWKIRLQASLPTPGYVTVTVNVGQDPNGLRTACTAQVSVTDSQWIELTGASSSIEGGGPNCFGDKLGDIRYVRINTTSSSANVAWREVEAYSGVEYFGYYQNGDLTNSETNLAWFILAPDYDPRDNSLAIGALNQARAQGGKLVVILDDRMFVNAQAYQGLRSDWQAALQSLFRAIYTGGYENSIAAWWFGEEQEMGDCHVQRNVQQVANFIRTPSSFTTASPPPSGLVTLTRAPLATLFTADQIAAWGASDTPWSGLPISECANLTPSDYPRGIHYAFDWVGFDCYGDWDRCGDVYNPNSGYPTSDLIAALRPRLLPSQRMIAVPSAYLFQDAAWYGKSFDEGTIIQSNINKWHQEVLADGKYVAVMPWAWHDLDFTYKGPDDGAGAGVFRYGANQYITNYIKPRMKEFSRSLLSPSDPQLYSVNQWASNSSTMTYPMAALDGDITTAWTSPSSAPYLVAESFGGSAHVTDVQLVARLPAPDQIGFVIEGCAASPASACETSPDSVWSPLATFAGPLADGQQLSFHGNWDVAALRVRTTQGPAAAGWYEVQALQAKPPLRSTFLTGSFGALGGDGFHLDQAGRLWHLAYGATSWSLVPNAPTLAGFARLTSTTASSYDAIVATGADGHLYQYSTQAGSPYAWHDMGVPPDCDGVVGAPSVGSGDPANANLGISYRCNNNHVGSASKSGLGPWQWTFATTNSQPPAGIASDPTEGFDTHVYVVGYDGRLYRCTPNGPGAGCSFTDGNPYPNGYNFVGTPGVAYSQTTPNTFWVLVADTFGEMWQFDAYNGVWTVLGHPSCGNAEGDVSAAVDSVHNVWLAAVRCTNHDTIAVYAMTPGSPWQQVDTITYGGLPLSKPLVTAQGHLTVAEFETNVSFETSAGEQVLVWYVDGLQRRYVQSMGNAAP